MTALAEIIPITRSLPLRIKIERSPKGGGYALALTRAGVTARAWAPKGSQERLVEMAAMLAGVSARVALVIVHQLRLGLVVTGGKFAEVVLPPEVLVAVDNGSIPPAGWEVR